jgi:hypothetical protein
MAWHYKQIISAIFADPMISEGSGRVSKAFCVFGQTCPKRKTASPKCSGGFSADLKMVYGSIFLIISDLLLRSMR